MAKAMKTHFKNINDSLYHLKNICENEKIFSADLKYFIESMSSCIENSMNTLYYVTNIMTKYLELEKSNFLTANLTKDQISRITKRKRNISISRIISEIPSDMYVRRKDLLSHYNMYTNSYFPQTSFETKTSNDVSNGLNIKSEKLKNITNHIDSNFGSMPPFFRTENEENFIHRIKEHKNASAPRKMTAFGPNKDDNYKINGIESVLKKSTLAFLVNDNEDSLSVPSENRVNSSVSSDDSVSWKVTISTPRKDQDDDSESSIEEGLINCSKYTLHDVLKEKHFIMPGAVENNDKVTLSPLNSKIPIKRQNICTKENEEILPKKKAHGCPHCPKRYNWKKSLSRHLRKKHLSY